MKQIKRYKYRIYPDAEQKKYIDNNIYWSRVFYNKRVENNKYDYILAYYYKMAGLEIPRYTSNEQRKRVLDELPFLKEADSVSLNNANSNFESALTKMMKWNKTHQEKIHLHFKKADGCQSYTTGKHRGRNEKPRVVEEQGNCWLQLPKLASNIKVVYHRPLPSDYATVTISREPSGKYYVSFCVEEDVQPLPRTNQEIGVDLGEKDIAILSNGFKYENLSSKFSALDKKIAKEKAILSRRQLNALKQHKPLREAKNYQKQRIKVARLEERKRNIRDYYYNQIAIDLVRNYDLIGIEDLSIKEMQL